MRSRWFLPVLTLLIFGWSLLHADPPTAERIEELVKQLGSAKFAERDKAKRELETIGAAALPALKEAAKSEDVELSRRAGDLLRTLHDKLTTAAYLAPKKVRLNVKETSVLDAVDQLSKLSGYPLEVEGDRTILAERKITLDTGEVPFWQAFDQLCAKGNLIEVTPTNPYGIVPGQDFFPKKKKGKKGFGGGLVDPLQPRIIRPLDIQQVPPLPLRDPAPNPFLPQLDPIPIPPALQDALDKLEKQQQKEKGLTPAAKQMREALDKALQLQVKQLNTVRGVAVQAGGIRIGGAGGIGGNGAGGVGGQPGQPGLPGVGGGGQPGQPGRPGAGGAGQPGQPGLPGVGGAGAGQPGQPGLPGVRGAGGVGGAGAAGQPAQPRAIALDQRPIGVDVTAAPPEGPLTPIAVKDGKPPQYPTYYSGSVRIRALPASKAAELGITTKEEGEIMVILEVSAEPRLQNFRLVGTPRIDKALDDQDQFLFPNAEEAAIANGGIIGYYSAAPQRYVPVRFKADKKESKEFKELSGAVSAQVPGDTTDLLVIDNVMKANNKAAKHPNGGSLTLLGIEKQGDNYYVDVRMVGDVADAAGRNFQGNGARVIIQINGRMANVPPANAAPPMQLPSLVDAKGKVLQFQGSRTNQLSVTNDIVSREMTLVYRTAEGIAEPARLVITGQQQVTFQIPFALENVPAK